MQAQARSTSTARPIPPYRETRAYVSKITRLVQPIKMAGTTIYKVTEVIDGREVVKYTDRKPQ